MIIGLFVWRGPHPVLVFVFALLVVVVLFCCQNFVTVFVVVAFVVVACVVVACVVVAYVVVASCRHHGVTVFCSCYLMLRDFT